MSNGLGIDVSKLRSWSLTYPMPFPYPGGWAMSDEACRLVGVFIRWARPRRVLEFGSGFSSVVIAGELARQQAGRLDSIDNSPQWSQAAREMAQSQDLLERIEYHCFSLGLRIYHGMPCVFYKIPSTFYEHRGPYDLVIVDGPQADVGRDGALLESFKRLKVGGYMILDDCKSSHMERTLAKWKMLFRHSVFYGEALDIGNGIGIIRKVQNLQPDLFSVPLHLCMLQWLRTARNLLRVNRLDLNSGGGPSRPGDNRGGFRQDFLEEASKKTVCLGDD